jgi:L-threonylcarbamoyladenylate synthase
MEAIQLTEGNIAMAIGRAEATLRSGGIVLYPTDTLYGLGADAFSNEAVAKVYAIKGRDEKKPIHCVVASIDAAGTYAEVNDLARTLARKFLPGPLTLVLKKKPGIDSGIAKGMATFGIRIPQNEFCLGLAEKFGPFTTTSANLSGEGNVPTVEGVLSQLGERASLIDLVIDGGELPPRDPSTVVDVSSGEFKVLREGAVSLSDIQSAAR